MYRELGADSNITLRIAGLVATKHLSNSFEDFFDGSMNRFTFHFMWCCYALAWGINKYDKSKENKNVDSSD